MNRIQAKLQDDKKLLSIYFTAGYPNLNDTVTTIENLEQIEISDMNYLFHAGTIKKDNKIYAVGGRVLNFVSVSDNFSDSKKNIIDNIERLNWPGGFYRKDIGYKVIK